MAIRRQALSRGLGALVGGSLPGPAPEPEGIEPSSPPERDIRAVPIEDIHPNPFQPRKTFSSESLQELAASITTHGILQPILVTRRASHQGFILVAGERRFRAAQLAGLPSVPALVTDASDEEMLEIALVENVQRDDLNAMEEARAYRAFVDRFAWNHERIAERVGKNRTTVVNSLRLLKLNGEAQKDVEEGRLSAGHARAILSLEDSRLQDRLRMEIIEQDLSVRAAERRAAELAAGTPKPAKKGKEKASQLLDTVALEDRLMAHLGCRVKIRSRDGKSGSLQVPFRNPEELQRFLDAIGLTD